MNDRYIFAPAEIRQLERLDDVPPYCCLRANSFDTSIRMVQITLYASLNNAELKTNQWSKHCGHYTRCRYGIDPDGTVAAKAPLVAHSASDYNMLDRFQGIDG